MDKPASPFSKLDLEDALRLRWVLRDIKGKRLKWSPISPEDLKTLVEMGLVAMSDNQPTVTNAGLEAIS